MDSGDNPIVNGEDAALAHKLANLNRAQRRELAKKLTRKPRPKRKRKPRK